MKAKSDKLKKKEAVKKGKELLIQKEKEKAKKEKEQKKQLKEKQVKDASMKIK